MTVTQLLILLFAWVSLFTLILLVIQNAKHKIELELKQNEPPKEPPKEKPKQKVKGKPEPETFIQTMDYLLVMGVIDMKEYNQIISKAIPFF
jgi:hypothetical protein